MGDNPKKEAGDQLQEPRSRRFDADAVANDKRLENPVDRNSNDLRNLEFGRCGETGKKTAFGLVT